MRQRHPRSPTARRSCGCPALREAPDEQHTEDAWKALTLTVEMVKHAETKAAATLAGTGVLGGILYALAQRQQRPGLLSTATITLCAVFILGAVLGASNSLRPRSGPRQAYPNLLYYRHVARSHRQDPAAYAEALAALLGDRRQLTTTVATQVWVNAHVATAKYRWGNLSVLFFLAAAATLGVAAVVAYTTS